MLAASSAGSRTRRGSRRVRLRNPPAASPHHSPTCAHPRTCHRPWAVNPGAMNKLALASTGRASETLFITERVSGGPGQLPAQGSHRSGRAELPHPAPRAAGSLAQRYLLQFRVDVGRALGLGHRSSQQFRDTASPSLRRVPATRFPAFIGTMARSDSSMPVPRPFVSFGRRYRGCTHLLRGVGGCASPAGIWIAAPA